MRQISKHILITPLDRPAFSIVSSLPFSLGFGFEVRDMREVLRDANLEVWKSVVSDQERDRIRGWSFCLTHTYTENMLRGTRQNLSETLMHYVVAHLRLIVPNVTNADRILRATVESNKFDPLSIGVQTPPLFLEDCEEMCSEIDIPHLEKLRSWMPWIVRFRRRWRSFYPLYLSLYFAEMARAEDDARVRHVLRVMALEALLSTDTTYGFNALSPKIPKLLGPKTDIYAQYRNSDQPFLPQLIVSNVLKDVCRLRNAVAHGAGVPPDWLVPNRRPTFGLARELNYAEELLEASTGMLNLVWQTIIDSRLQITFATKSKMEGYFKTRQRKRRP
jgi:hypothetical protein